MEDITKLSKEEQIAFHKGVIDTLMKEKAELERILSIVDAKLAFHLEELRKLGVELFPKFQPGPKKEEEPLEEKL